jgi:hypothetical protein
VKSGGGGAKYMAVDPNMANVRAEGDVQTKVLAKPFTDAPDEPTPTTQVPANLFQKLVKSAPIILQTSALRARGPLVVWIKLDAVPPELCSSCAYCTIPETVKVTFPPIAVKENILRDG